MSGLFDNSIMPGKPQTSCYSFASPSLECRPIVLLSLNAHKVTGMTPLRHFQARKQKDKGGLQKEVVKH